MVLAKASELGQLAGTCQAWWISDATSAQDSNVLSWISGFARYHSGAEAGWSMAGTSLERQWWKRLPSDSCRGGESSKPVTWLLWSWVSGGTMAERCQSKIGTRCRSGWIAEKWFAGDLELTV